jgi:predicted RNase H-like HicB family nuclease
MLHIEVDRETDGRYIAEVLELPGVMAYGNTPESAIIHAVRIALIVISERIELHFPSAQSQQ